MFLSSLSPPVSPPPVGLHHSVSPSISSGLDARRDRNMAVNLAKNRLALLTAYQDVIDETSDTDW